MQCAVNGAGQTAQRFQGRVNVRVQSAETRTKLTIVNFR